MGFSILLKSLEDYSNCLDAYLILTENKIKAISMNDTQALEHIVSEEHPYLMKIKSFESKRLQNFEALGFSDYTLETFIKNTPDEFRNKAETISNQIKNTVFKIKANNSAINDILAIKLYKLKNILDIKPSSIIYKNV